MGLRRLVQRLRSPFPRRPHRRYDLISEAMTPAGSVRSAGVVEDDAERGPLAAGDGADAVAHADAVVAVLALVGALLGGEDHERAARRLEHVRAALRARALLEQHE